MKIPKIAESTLEGGITISAILDTRHLTIVNNATIAIRVTFQRKCWYYDTGISVAVTTDGDKYEEYIAICNARGTKGKYSPVKMDVIKVFEKIKNTAQKIYNSPNGFSLMLLQQEVLRSNNDTEKRRLYDYWCDYGESKVASKTKEQYRQACTSFYKSLGCTNVHKMENGEPSKRMTLQGKALSLQAHEVTTSMIDGWASFCNKQGNSAATISMYQRALRALLRHLMQTGIVKQVPAFSIKAGARRKDDYLTVPDILKIQNYQGPHRAEADFWLILYFMNGCNLKDAALLRYNTDYQYNNELSFVRSKTAHKSPSKVYIPIIPPLRSLLDKYAAPFADGDVVFPEILLGAKTEKQIDNRIHDFNQWIRVGMQSVCKTLKLKIVSASAARNSYITCLTWHGISDAFIDAMTGHVGNNDLLRGYQGTISPKKRYEVNMHLLRDPEEEVATMVSNQKTKEDILLEIERLKEQLNAYNESSPND